MAFLDSKLTNDDLNTLVEAMSDWESIGNHEYHLMNAVRSAIMPPEDSESHEFVKMVKDHYRAREKEIKDTRLVRQERAVFLKAKLMLARSSNAVEQLFDQASTPVEEKPQIVQPGQVLEGAGSELTQEERTQTVEAPSDKLVKEHELALRYMKECGIWGHWEKFLAAEMASV